MISNAFSSGFNGAVDEELPPRPSAQKAPVGPHDQTKNIRYRYPNITFFSFVLLHLAFL